MRHLGGLCLGVPRFLLMFSDMIFNKSNTRTPFLHFGAPQNIYSYRRDQSLKNFENRRTLPVTLNNRIADSINIALRHKIMCLVQ